MKMSQLTSPTARSSNDEDIEILDNDKENKVKQRNLRQLQISLTQQNLFDPLKSKNIDLSQLFQSKQDKKLFTYFQYY